MIHIYVHLNCGKSHRDFVQIIYNIAVFVFTRANNEAAVSTLRAQTDRAVK